MTPRPTDPLASERALWQALGASDPMWAVLSDPARRGGGWTQEEFFASGRAEVERIMAFVAELGLRPGRERALDFGCGVGRLTRALAAHADAVLGLDIAPAMVAAAREANADVPACTFALNPGADLRTHADASFDLVLSLIALQHVRSAALVAGYVAEFVRVLRPGGVAVFQIPAAVPARVRHHPGRVLVRAAGPRLLRRVPALAPYAMELTPLPEAEVRRVVGRAGGTVVAAVPDGRTGSAALPSLGYVVTR